MISNSTVCNKYYPRMAYIHKQLSDVHVPHVFDEIAGGYHIVFPWTNGYVAANESTYGHDEKKVECVGFSSDYSFSPDDCVNMIIDSFLSKRKMMSESNDCN